MRLIGIDPGTHCGYAWTDTFHVEPEQSGVWNLTPPKHRRGHRPMMMRRELEALVNGHTCAVFYEDVKGQKSLYAAQCYGALVGAIEGLCEERGIAYSGFHTSAVKKRATGRGNADKLAMCAAFEIEFGRRFDVKENDRVDALYILALGIQELRA